MKSLNQKQKDEINILLVKKIELLLRDLAQLPDISYATNKEVDEMKRLINEVEKFL